MENINDLINKGAELAKKHEDLENEILSNPDIQQEIKDFIINSKIKMEKQKELYKKNREENKHRKIIGYNPETFEPIYE